MRQMTRFLRLTTGVLLWHGFMTAQAQAAPAQAGATGTASATEAPLLSAAPAPSAVGSAQVAPPQAAETGATQPASPAQSGATSGVDVVPEPPSGGPQLSVHGDLWSRLEVRQGYDRLGKSQGRFLEGDAFFYRARLGFDIEPVELGDGQRISVHIVPQADGFWGQLNNTVTTPNLGLYEAYLRWSTATTTLDVGHLALNYGDALIIGNLDWHQTGRAFDGAKLRLASQDGASWIDLFATYLAEGRDSLDTSLLAGDQVFGGLYAELGPLLSPKTSVQPYVLGQFWARQDDLVVSEATAAMAAETADAKSAGLMTVGLRLTQDYGALDLRVEGGYQGGAKRVGADVRHVAAYQIDGEVGVKPMAGLRLALEALYASGDDADSADEDEGWNQLFPTGHKFLGLMDIIGARSNVASGVFHVSYAGAPAWMFKADAHLFVRPQTMVGEADGYAGTEIDANAIYKLAPGLTLRGMYAVFIPGFEHFGSGPGSDRVAHYTELQFGYGF